MNKSILKIRIFLWLILVLVISFIIFKGIVPSGHITYINDFEKDSFFVQKLTPKERVEEIHSGTQKIIGDPVYFSLRTPRTFNMAKVILKYRNGSDLPIVQAGVLVDKTVWRYDLRPLNNEIINKLSLVWDVISDDGTVLLQQEKKYNSIQEFLDNLPERKRIGVFNYDLEPEYLLEDYSSSTQEETIDIPIMGAYEFYTYIKDEDLDYKFTLADLNQNKDKDEINIRIYYQDELIDAKHLEDDGVVEDKGEISNDREFAVKLSNLPEGVYKIEFKTNDDIITKKITTKQSKTSFIGRLNLARDSGSDITLFSDSRSIQAKTISPDRLQTISINDLVSTTSNIIELEINETYRQFETKAYSRLNKISLETDGVIISGDGVFSFDQDMLINPRLNKIDQNSRIGDGGIKYIIANYRGPLNRDGWKESVAEFDLKGAYRENGAYSLIISIPDLRADDDIEDYLEIDQIMIELKGRTLLEKIKEFFTH